MTEHSSLILTDDGLYVSGSNEHGERGDSNKDVFVNFTFVENTDFDFRNVIEMECSVNNSYFLTKNQEIYATGNNSHGQRGTGVQSREGTRKPELVTVFNMATKPFKKMKASYSGLYIVDANDILWGVGQFLPGTNGTPQYTAVQCSNTIKVKFIYTSVFSPDVHIIGKNNKVYFAGTRWSSEKLEDHIPDYPFKLHKNNFYKKYKEFYSKIKQVIRQSVLL